MHPLDDAYAKLDRADQHFESLKVEMRRFREKRAHSIGGYTDPDSGTYILYVAPRQRGGESVPAYLRTHVADVFNNLRPALDYLVYAFVETVTGSPKEGTQFPIADTPESFQGCVKRGWLGDLSPEAVALFERCQPYNGWEWLALLRDLSNPDKHKKLTTSFTDLNGGFEIIKRPPERRLSAMIKSALAERVTGGADDASTLDALRRDTAKTQTQKPRISFSVPPEHELHEADVHVHVGVSVRVAFDNGLPVVETLEILKTQTRDLVDVFKPAFDSAE